MDEGRERVRRALDRAINQNREHTLSSDFFSAFLIVRSWAAVTLVSLLILTVVFTVFGRIFHPALITIGVVFFLYSGARIFTVVRSARQELSYDNRHYTGYSKSH